MDPVAQLLQQKRAQLEQEIADFTSKKEDEYRSYEQQYLQARPNGSAPNGANNGFLGSRSNCQISQEHVHGANKAALPLNDDSDQFVLEGKFKKPTTVEGGARFDQVKNDTEGLEALSFSQRHEREMEFKGLFTPSYLPLLGAQRRKPKPPNLETNTCNGKIISAPENQSGTANLSSSATFPSNLSRFSPSPPPARPLSASVPRQPAHHRRSSSRSDISITSLRSSLRDPRQPRSPKRVLFSLDNGVVSPSTSPVAQRTRLSGEIVQPQQPEVFVAPQPLGSFGPPAVGNIGSNQLYKSYDTEVQQPNTVMNGRSKGKNANPQFRSSGAIDSSLTTGGDDFENIDMNDDMFAFDEDLGNDDAEEGSQEGADDDPGSDNEDRHREPLMASSPHAGSLPIEIKWPERLKPH